MVKWVLLLWLVFLVTVPLWAWTKVEKVDAEPDGSRPDEQPGTTYLLVGSDSRAGLTEEDRQDNNPAATSASAPTRSCCCTSAPGPTC